MIDKSHTNDDCADDQDSVESHMVIDYETLQLNLTHNSFIHLLNWFISTLSNGLVHTKWLYCLLWWDLLAGPISHWIIDETALYSECYSWTSTCYQNVMFLNIQIFYTPGIFDHGIQRKGIEEKSFDCFPIRGNPTESEVFIRWTNHWVRRHSDTVRDGILRPLIGW